MWNWITLLIYLGRAVFTSPSKLALENVALRQQVNVLRRRSPKPVLTYIDRLFWVGLSIVWPDWRSALDIVKPETVLRWHKGLFKAYWRRKCERGRKPIADDVIALIRKFHAANPTWGAPRIHGELLKLGIDVSQATISRYMAVDRPSKRQRRKAASQTWKTFLANHAKDMVAIDFFTVRTLTFNVFFVFLVLDHDRRKILHFNVTDSPSAKWTAQQIIEAFPEKTAPKYLIRDRDGTYGKVFRNRIKNMGIEEVLCAPRSPWQNALCERAIGTLRRDGLDHVIILNERHLMRVLRQLVAYYHSDRTHLGLDKDCPVHRAVEPPEDGPIREIPILGGLHHRYTRKAA